MVTNSDYCNNEKLIHEWVASGDRVVCERNQIIYEENLQAKSLYLLEQGDINISQDGIVLFSLSRLGDIIGWSSLYKNAIYQTTAVSTTISSVIRIPGETAQEILDKHKNTKNELCKHFDYMFSKQMVKKTG